MDVMENKIIVDAKLVLSKQQIYLINLCSGMGEIDAKESADFLFNNPDKASKSLSDYNSTYGEGSTVNDIFTLGLLAYFKNTGEALKDEDIYYSDITIKKYVIKAIEIELQDVDNKYIDRNNEPIKS
jgi:hypothetical protein